MEHTPKSTPPRELPQVILRMKEAYRFWTAIHRDFPKVERLGLGQKIESAFLEAIELTFICSYLSVAQKLPVLTKAISRLDIVKFFIQLSWENKLVPTEKYSSLMDKIGEIGRQLGGWKKGLETKTPAAKQILEGEKQ